MLLVDLLMGLSVDVLLGCCCLVFYRCLLIGWINSFVFCGVYVSAFAVCRLITCLINLLLL